MSHLFILFLLIHLYLNSAERCIGLITKPDYRGEISFAYRIKSACANIGWRADVIDFTNHENLRKHNYDFVINLIPGGYKFPKCKNYLAIFHPIHHFFDKNGFLYKGYRSYDGYLVTHVSDNFDTKEINFTNSDQFSCMQWYPTVQKQEFHTKDPRFLFHIPCTWGDRFLDIKFKQCFQLLEEMPYMRFYGDTMFKKRYPKSYCGEISYEGNSLYKKLAQAGVVLVIHSAEHNRYGLPSGRIFEAAAVSSVIICDKNAFVQDHFGNSVLYIDTDKSSRSIFNQIQNHMEWIRENKAEALDKAMRAHAIFEDKFLLEDQLLKLEEFHNQIINNVY
jgi:hypothetical protein